MLIFVVIYFASGLFAMRFILPLYPIPFPKLYKYKEETQSRSEPRNDGVIYLILFSLLAYSMLHFGIQNTLMEYYYKTEIKNGVLIDSYILYKEIGVRELDRDTLYYFNYTAFFLAHNKVFSYKI